MKELNKRQKRVRHLSLFCAVFVCSVLAVGCSVSFGAVKIHPFEVFRIIMNHLSGREIFFPTWETNMETIIWNIRLPRVVLAWFVGAGLSVCGVLMQALTKMLWQILMYLVFLPELQQERYVPSSQAVFILQADTEPCLEQFAERPWQLYYPWRLQHIREPLLRHS